MTKKTCEHILFTGAGFTKNFGGLLAKEMWSKIFNNIKIQSCPRIKKLMINDFDYESIYHKIINGNYTEEEKNVISDVILKVYQSLDDICEKNQGQSLNSELSGSNVVCSFRFLAISVILILRHD